MKNCIIETKLSTKKKASPYILFAISTLFLFTLLLVMVSLINSTSNQTVFTIDGQSVSKSEFVDFMESDKGSVYSDFVQRHGQQNSANFWTANFNGQVPIDTLKQQTLDKLKSIKEEQILFKKYGLANDISYSGFLKALNAENNLRKKKAAQKAVIYGPEQYDAKVYYDYLQGDRREKLQTKLLSTNLAASNKEIQAYYDDHKNLFKKQNNIKIEKISIPYSNQKGVGSLDLKTRASDASQQILKNINQGDSFENAIQPYAGEDWIKIEDKTQVVHGESDKYDINIVEALSNLSTGQVSGVIDDGNAFNIIRVLQYLPAEYKSLADVKSQIISSIADSKYHQMIDNLVKKAKVSVNSDVYKSISIQST